MVQTAWSYLGSTVERKALVGTGRAISVVFGINGLRNKPSCLVGIHGPFFRYGRLDCKFVNWWVWLKIRICLGWLKITCGSSFDVISNIREQKLGYTRHI